MRHGRTRALDAVFGLSSRTASHATPSLTILVALRKRELKMPLPLPTHEETVANHIVFEKQIFYLNVSDRSRR
jgi:hypothetical protein